jgi:ribosome-associated protein
MDKSKELATAIVEGLQEKKGKNIVTVDLSNISGAICQYIVIASGNTPTQVAALEDSVRDYVRNNLREKPLSVDADQRSEWIGMDYGTVIVHIFVPGLRNFYDLEHLWEDAKLEHIPDLD